MNISVVIPAYNEENRLKETLERSIEFLKKKFNKYEIIVVDDNSKDATYKLASSFSKHNVITLKNEKNFGKGYSVKKGILASKYNIILFMDSDLATPLNELDDMLTKLHDGNDIVIASRNIKGSKRNIKQNVFRQFLGRTYPFLVNFVLSLDFKDTQCGFKLFNSIAARRIFILQKIRRFGFDAEIIFIAKKLGYRIVEFPVLWTDKKGSKVNVFRDAFIMLLDLLKVRYYDFTRKYNY